MDELERLNHILDWYATELTTQGVRQEVRKAYLSIMDDILNRFPQYKKEFGGYRSFLNARKEEFK